MEIPSLIFCRRTTGWHTGLRHTRFGRNPRKAAQGKTVRVRADLHHIIKIETAKNGGNVKEVMDKALEEYIRKYLPDKL